MRSIEVRSIRPLTNPRCSPKGMKRELEAGKTREEHGGLVGWKGARELFRVGYRHCFTVDENLICTVRSEEEEKEEEKEEEENQER